MDSSTTITSLDLASSSRHLPFEEQGFVDADPEELRFRRPAPLGEAAASSGVGGVAASSMDMGMGFEGGMTPRHHVIPSSASVPSFAYLSGGATPSRRRGDETTTPRRHADATTTPRRHADATQRSNNGGNRTLSGSRVNGNMTMPASPPGEGGGGVGNNAAAASSRYDLTAAAALARQQQWSLEMLDSLQR